MNNDGDMTMVTKPSRRRLIRAGVAGAVLPSPPARSRSSSPPGRSGRCG
jgi:hypothetical protein